MQRQLDSSLVSYKPIQSLCEGVSDEGLQARAIIFPFGLNAIPLLSPCFGCGMYCTVLSVRLHTVSRRLKLDTVIICREEGAHLAEESPARPSSILAYHIGSNRARTKASPRLFTLTRIILLS